VNSTRVAGFRAILGFLSLLNAASQSSRHVGQVEIGRYLGARA
jgi:hypothetical protein